MIPEHHAHRAGDPGAIPGARPLPPPWTEPLPSTAHRQVGLKSKGALRGRTLTNGTEPRRLLVESNGELGVAHVLLARRDVIELREQAAPVAYVDEDGADRVHFFDFVATIDTGERVAVAVKPEGTAERHDLQGTLRTIAAQMDPRIADRVVHLSERHASAAAVRDAKLIRSCRRDDRLGDDAVVRRLAETLLGTVTVGDLVRASGLKGSGFRAVVRAIGDGVLAVRGPAGIGYATRVAPVPPVEGGR